jgi:hypothetical protein
MKDNVIDGNVSPSARLIIHQFEKDTSAQPVLKICRCERVLPHPRRAKPYSLEFAVARMWSEQVGLQTQCNEPTTASTIEGYVTCQKLEDRRLIRTHWPIAHLPGPIKIGTKQLAMSYTLRIA